MICFFGPDGAGKTTHAELTSLYLKKKGYRIWRASIKQHHTISYLLLKLLSSGDPSRQTISYHGFGGRLKQKIKTPWKILELISLFPVLYCRVFLPLLMGYIVICDRYLPDTIVTLSYFLGDPKLISGTSAKLLSALIPKGTLLFYMNANTEVVLQRKRDEPLTSDLVEYYKRGYEILIKRFGLKPMTINTSTSRVADVQKIVLDRLMNSIAEY